MCDCAYRVHPGTDCGSENCHCHEDKVYLSMSFPKVDREKAELIVNAAMAIAGSTSMNVYYDEALAVDEDDDELVADDEETQND